MSQKPIFCCTHPRSCSTAFERVFMTRRDILKCIHEPFGDAFYFGPERMSTRYADEEETRSVSGFSNTTYQDVFDRFEREGSEGKRLFIKDMMYYIVPPSDQPPMIAPSLSTRKRGIGTMPNGSETNGVSSIYPWHTAPEKNNPTVVPTELLDKFHWIFLIRDPHRAVPSWYRCVIPPLQEMTGFKGYDPAEAGVREVRKVFDYLRTIHAVGPHTAEGSRCGSNVEAPATNGIVSHADIEICVLDADDILDEPAKYVEACCKSTGIDYNPRMLEWGGEEDQSRARKAFEKWKGFHEDVLQSTGLRARERTSSSSAKNEEQWDAEWKEKYGMEAAKVIRESVDSSMADYLYLKKFALSL